MRSVIRSARALSVLAAGLLLTLGVVFAPGSVSAQDAAPHPARIHSGTCGDGLGAYPLTDVGSAMMVNDTPMAMSDMIAADAIPVELGSTVVQAPLSDLVGEADATNVHEFAANIGDYIACGNIGGVMMGTSDLAIGLGTLNDSGYSGVATLHDNGDGTTTVNVYLMHLDGM